MRTSMFKFFVNGFFVKKKEVVDLPSWGLRYFNGLLVDEPDEDFDILTAFSCMLEELDVLDDLTGTSV